MNELMPVCLSDSYKTVQRKLQIILLTYVSIHEEWERSQNVGNRNVQLRKKASEEIIGVR